MNRKADDVQPDNIIHQIRNRVFTKLPFQLSEKVHIPHPLCLWFYYKDRLQFCQIENEKPP